MSFSGQQHHIGGRRAMHDAPDRFGAITAAHAVGLSVPDDLSIVGYDDIQLARWMSPQLTTVHQPLRRMGEEATRLVLRMADGVVPETLQMDLATPLVVRESTAPPPSWSTPPARKT